MERLGLAEPTPPDEYDEDETDDHSWIDFVNERAEVEYDEWLAELRALEEKKQNPKNKEPKGEHENE